MRVQAWGVGEREDRRGGEGVDQESRRRSRRSRRSRKGGMCLFECVSWLSLDIKRTESLVPILDQF